MELYLLLCREKPITLTKRAALLESVRAWKLRRRAARTSLGAAPRSASLLPHAATVLTGLAVVWMAVRLFV